MVPSSYKYTESTEFNYFKDENKEQGTKDMTTKFPMVCIYLQKLYNVEMHLDKPGNEENLEKVLNGIQNKIKSKEKFMKEIEKAKNDPKLLEKMYNKLNINTVEELDNFYKNLKEENIISEKQLTELAIDPNANIKEIKPGEEEVIIETKKKETVKKPKIESIPFSLDEELTKEYKDALKKPKKERTKKTMTVGEIKKLLKEKGVKGYSKLKKAQLLLLL